MKIYKLVNSVTNGVYIGKTSNLSKRLLRHKSQLRSGRHYSKKLQAIWDGSDGDIGLDIVLIATAANEKQASELELEHQKQTPKNLLLNARIVSSGGDTISKHPKNKEFRELQRELYKKNKGFQDGRRVGSGKENPNYRHGKCIPDQQFCKVCGAKVSVLKDICVSCVKIGDGNPFYGRSHTKETKEKIAKAQSGKKNYRDCKPYRIGDDVYYALSDGEEKTGIKGTTIRHRIISKNPKYDSYQYLTEEEREVYLNAKRPSK